MRYPDIAIVAEEAKNLPQLDFEIRQLEISHDDLYLVIVSEKDIAICVLPSEGFLKHEAARLRGCWCLSR